MIRKSPDPNQNGGNHMLYKKKPQLLSCKDFKLNKRDLKAWSALLLSHHATPQAAEGSKRLEPKQLHHATAGIEKAGWNLKKARELTWVTAIHSQNHENPWNSSISRPITGTSSCIGRVQIGTNTQDPWAGCPYLVCLSVLDLIVICGTYPDAVGQWSYPVHCILIKLLIGQ